MDPSTLIEPTVAKLLPYVLVILVFVASGLAIVVVTAIKFYRWLKETVSAEAANKLASVHEIVTSMKKAFDDHMAEERTWFNLIAGMRDDLSKMNDRIGNVENRLREMENHAGHFHHNRKSDPVREE